MSVSNAHNTSALPYSYFGQNALVLSLLRHWDHTKIESERKHIPQGPVLAASQLILFSLKECVKALIKQDIISNYCILCAFVVHASLYLHSILNKYWKVFWWKRDNILLRGWFTQTQGKKSWVVLIYFIGWEFHIWVLYIFIIPTNLASFISSGASDTFLKIESSSRIIIANCLMVTMECFQPHVLCQYLLLPCGDISLVIGMDYFISTSKTIGLLLFWSIGFVFYSYPFLYFYCFTQTACRNVSVSNSQLHCCHPIDWEIKISC